LPHGLLQYQQSAVGRDEHVEPAAPDDHIAGVLDHAGEEVGGRGRGAVGVSEEDGAVDAVAEDAATAASCPARGAWGDVQGAADVWLGEPGGLFGEGGWVDVWVVRADGGAVEWSARGTDRVE
jgi:hypothetical protein